MVSKKDVISGLLILVAIILVVLIFYVVGVIPDLVSFAEKLVISISASIIVAVLGLIVRGIRKKEEKIPAMSSKKDRGWLSRFRLNLKGRRRPDVWEMAFGSVIMGPIFTIIMITFNLSEPQAAQASLIAIFMRIFGICFGIGLTAWGVILTSNLVYDWWEARQRPIRQQRNAYLKVTKDFDNAFEAVQQVSDTSTKKIMLIDFQSQLAKLTKYEWEIVKNRIEKVLDRLIPERLSEDPHARLHIQFLAMIIDKYRQNVVETISKKWLKEFERMYSDPTYQTADISVIFGIFQELHGYDENFLERLIDDATRWTPMKFTLLSQNIRFSELKKRDEVAYSRVLKYLRRKMDDAGKNENEEIFQRFVALHDIAKRQDTSLT